MSWTPGTKGAEAAVAQPRDDEKPEEGPREERYLCVRLRRAPAFELGGDCEEAALPRGG
jgi:hypothetical protein